jgi:hypothetical protein
LPFTDRSVKGVNRVCALYVSQDAWLPVDFELVDKTELIPDKKSGPSEAQ